MKIWLALTDTEWNQWIAEMAATEGFAICTHAGEADLAVIDSMYLGPKLFQLFLCLGEVPAAIKDVPVQTVPLPFSRKDLVVALRKAYSFLYPADALKLGYWGHKNVFVDFNHNECRVQFKPVNLTDTEFSIFKCLVLSNGARMSRDDILQTAIDHKVCDKTLDTHISSLRKKVAGFSDCIESVRGEGYRFTV